ncbi:MAG TPA: LysR substrate-binding domain-containing protein [Candidatus Nanoarchaeia archaeon]|nr:LysR substrate-binding domain-containing protein [Candidatus Nanoarchaeia archaeon]
MRLGQSQRVDIDFRYLRYFIAVAEEKSFTRAADRLHTVQPSLSRQMRRLEELLGVSLFVRDGHGVCLTEAGRVLLDESRALTEHLDRSIRVVQQAARAEQGELRVGFIFGTETSDVFTKLLPLLKQQCPELNVNYRGFAGSELYSKLESGEINVAFGPGPVEILGVTAEPVLLQRIVAALAAHHPLAKLKRIPIHQLAKVPIIRPSKAIDWRYCEFIDSIARQVGCEFGATLDRDNVLSGLHAVKLGLGVALIPDYQKSILPGGVVTRGLDLDPQPTHRLLMAYHKDDHSPAMAYFVSFVRECVAGAKRKTLL